MIEIISPGALATVQDLGRQGLAHLGVPRSGAFDRSALRLANRLVGNPDGAAAIEATMGIAFRALDATTIACTGAPCAGGDWNAAISLAAGTAVRLQAPTRGVRSYIAVRGGIAVEPVLGSRSTDLLSGLGPEPLRTGDVLTTLGEPHSPVLGASAAPKQMLSTLSITPGPRDDWFEPGTIERLCAAEWMVQPEANRIGIRLAGPRLERAIDAELPSEPTLPGALQVPADGRPILFGPDAPVTGGYPVIAVVDAVGLDAVAQLRPGDIVRFRSGRG